MKIHSSSYHYFSIMRFENSSVIFYVTCNKLHLMIAIIVNPCYRLIINKMNSNVNPFICRKTKNVSKSTKRKQTIHKHNRRDIFLCKFRQRYFILVACYMNIMFVLLWLVANLILIKCYYQYWNFWNDTFIETKISVVAESFGDSTEKYLKYSIYILDITNTPSIFRFICRYTIVLT